MSDASKGYLSLVLHAHLPYVMAHGRWPHGMDWLCEAATECYIPILRFLEKLEREGCRSSLTMGITPVLAEQLRDPDFVVELEAYCDERTKRAHEAVEHLERTGENHLADLSNGWLSYYESIKRSFFDEYHADIIGAYARLQDRGRIEMITSAATHGYLPLLGRDTSVQAQVRLGVATYEKHFGRKPRGIWLPECAYRPRYEWSRPSETARPGPAVLRKGVDEFLSESGLEYFIVDTHLLRGGTALGVYRHRFRALEQLWAQFEGQYQPSPVKAETTTRPYLTCSAPAGKRPVAFFVRDEGTGLQVWSGEHGYPGDGRYLDFHKKYFPGGFRNWEVTRAKSDLAEKRLYLPEEAARRIPEHARHYIEVVRSAAAGGSGETPPHICCPFDAELFGHWWFEGPEWLYQVLALADQQPDLDAVALETYLSQFPPETVVALPEGSWGEGGYHFIWLNQLTSWTWTHIYDAEDRFAELLAQTPCNGNDGSLLSRVLCQVARELLLMQSSDWQFLISTWHARDYAELRFDRHCEAFSRLASMGQALLSGGETTEADMQYLSDVEARDRLFAEIDLKWFREVEYPAT